MPVISLILPLSAVLAAVAAATLPVLMTEERYRRACARAHTFATSRLH